MSAKNPEIKKTYVVEIMVRRSGFEKYLVEAVSAEAAEAEFEANGALNMDFVSENMTDGEEEFYEAYEQKEELKS